MRRFLPNAASVAAIAAALALSAPQARADVILEYSLDGGASFHTLVDVGSGTSGMDASASVGAFSISGLEVSSNSPGGPGLAQLLSATLDVTNTSASAATIEFVFSDVGFISPTAPPSLLLDSHVGGSVPNGGSDPTGMASFTSCVSTLDTNLTSCASGTDVAGPGAPDITTGSFKDDQFDTITSLAGPYSLISVVDLTLGAGGAVNYASTASLAGVVAIPEPLSLAVLGMALAGLGYARRRRRA